MELSPQVEAAPQANLARRAIDFLSDYRVGRTIVAALALTGATAGFAEYSSGASAETHIAASAPKTIESAADLPPGVELLIPGEKIFPGAKIYESSSKSANSAEASDVAKGKITILAYMNANGVPKKEITYPKCWWSEKGGLNSGTTIYTPGHPTLKEARFYPDSRPTLVCDVSRSVSPTGYEKAGNHGPNGTIIDNCGNYFIPFGKPPEHVTYVKTPEVILVKNFKEKMDIRVKATASAICYNQFGEVEAKASATGEASEEVTDWGYIKSGEGKGNDAVKLYDNEFGELKATAKASVHCSDDIIVIEEQLPTTTTTRPATTTTTTTRPATTTTTTRPATTTTTTTRPATTTTTTRPEYAPYVSAPANVEPVDEGATFVDCESAYSIPASDGVKLTATIQEGSVTTPKYNNSVGEFCETITAPDYIPNPDRDTVTITAIDEVNHLTSSANFYFAVREHN